MHCVMAKLSPQVLQHENLETERPWASPRFAHEYHEEVALGMVEGQAPYRLEY